MSEEKNKNIDIQKEFYRKQRIDLLKKRANIIVRVICILIIIVAFILVINRSVSYIKEVNAFSISNLMIEGNVILGVNDVLDILDLDEKENIFNLSLSKLKEKLELHPRIGAVVLKRELPNKVHVKISERKPVALVNIQSQSCHYLYEIDENGILISEYPNISNYNLPVITGLKLSRIILGEKLNNPALKNILDALKSIEKKVYNFSRFIAEINLSKKFNKTDITLYLTHYNTKIAFGENFSVGKLNKLNSLLIVIGNNISNLEYIDYKQDEAIGKFNG